jgi:hypothetical protein
VAAVPAALPRLQRTIVRPCLLSGRCDVSVFSRSAGLLPSAVHWRRGVRTQILRPSPMLERSLYSGEAKFLPSVPEMAGSGLFDTGSPDAGKLGTSSAARRARHRNRPSGGLATSRTQRLGARIPGREFRVRSTITLSTPCVRALCCRRAPLRWRSAVDHRPAHRATPGGFRPLLADHRITLPGCQAARGVHRADPGGPRGSASRLPPATGHNGDIGLIRMARSEVDRSATVSTPRPAREP